MRRLLFLQLPRLDNDVAGPRENVMLAAAYLQAALERSDEAPHWQTLATPQIQDEADDAHLADAVLALQPQVLGVTLYLWNVERTLQLVRRLKRRLPSLHVIAGGPEVARQHPLLYRGRTLDTAVIGEGEGIFPALLQALREKRRTDWSRVAHRAENFRWGHRPTPTADLATLLPPADHPVNHPDSHGMAYLETTRGCPMHCAFCCYNQRRRGVSALPPDQVQRRVDVLRERGAREIRLIDPTFNAVPSFRDTLKALRRANPDRALAFFLELRADTVTDADAALLAAAGVSEVEVGIQCTNRAVLRRIHRPVALDAVTAGVHCLLRHGIRPTLDMMAGLPGQTPDDLARSIDWLAQFPQAHPQFLHTLLLPGTELRDQRTKWGLKAQSRPPYRVLATPTLSAADLADAEARAIQSLGGAPDSPTPEFVAVRLTERFDETVHINATTPPATPPGHTNRRTLQIEADEWMPHLDTLCSALQRYFTREPAILWQLVLHLHTEEPLDVIDRLVATLDAAPSHPLDRLLVRPDGLPVRAARRVRVQLDAETDYDPDWRQALEALLADIFF